MYLEKVKSYKLIKSDLRERRKINIELHTALGSVRIVKSCGLGLKNAQTSVKDFHYMDLPTRNNI